MKHAGDAPASPREVLDRFDRWPPWMWANEQVVAFAEWLHDHNTGLPAGSRVGFSGLDVYSLWESMREILDLLHGAGCGPSLFVFPGDGQPGWMREVLPHRAIGVVYHPDRDTSTV